MELSLEGRRNESGKMRRVPLLTPIHGETRSVEAQAPPFYLVPWTLSWLPLARQAAVLPLSISGLLSSRGSPRNTHILSLNETPDAPRKRWATPLCGALRSVIQTAQGQAFGRTSDPKALGSLRRHLIYSILAHAPLG